MNVRGLQGAQRRFAVMAWVTGVLLAVMACIGLPLKYVFNATESGPLAVAYAIGWIAHGWLYVVYVAAALDIAFRLRLSVVRTVGVVLAGTIPFMSFVAEHFVKRLVRARLAADPVAG